MALFDLFKKPAVSNQSPINMQFDQSCYTLILSKLDNEHTNAESLWTKKHTPYPQICEKNTQDSQYRLMTALAKNTGKTAYYDEKLRRKRFKDFVYSDVVIWLPQLVLEKELRQQTNSLDMLTTNLAVLHQDYFKNKLLNERLPRYVVLPSTLLQADEIAFQFGAMIYIASADEPEQMLLEAIYLDEAGGQHSFVPQVSYHADSMSADNRIYAAQQTVFVMKPTEHQGQILPYQIWFSDLCNYVQLQNNKGQWRAFSSNPATITIESSNQAGHWQFEFIDNTIMSVNGTIPRLRLTLKPITPHDVHIETSANSDNYQPAPVNYPTLKPTPAGQAISHNQAWGATVIPDINRGQVYKTIIPGGNADPLLVLEGLALPRIDNASGRVNGLKQWTIWFDDFGNIVDGDNPLQRAQLAAVQANQQQAMAYFKLAGQNFVPLQANSQLYLGQQQAFVLPTPVLERFHAIIKLVHPINFALQTGIHYTVGRRGGDAIPEIDLTLLNDPLGMEWKAGSAHAGSMLSMLALSRNHVSFSLENQGLQLTVPANKQPVYLLNADLTLKDTLQNSQQASVAVLLKGEYLLLGCFLLRFQ